MKHLSKLLILLLLSNMALAQNKKERKGEFYFSWGYNKEWYTNSNVFVNQASLGNNYVINNVTSRDHPGWDEGLFSKPISIPQYNYRIGYFFNKKKNLAFEINFDHTKHIINDQNVHVTGIMNGRNIDTTRFFGETNDSTNSFYYLNNGANFLLFNIVKRWNWYENKRKKIKIDALAKFGIGPVIPHVENKFFNTPKNDPHFQIGGWNIGIEGAVRATFFDYVFIEFANKIDYARYSGLKIYEGTTHQAFGTYEIILNLGFTFPMGKKVQ